MKHYLLKLLLFFSPILLVVAIYVVLDPFMVVWHYDDYRVEDRAVFINRAYVSSRVFENQNDTCHYDSFIFGNSTSLNYYVADWQRYIGTGTHPFHFDAMNGSVEGIYLKVGFIDEHHAPIKNALVILDNKMLQKGDYRSHLFMQPATLTHNDNWVQFHSTQFMTFLSPQFLRAYFDYLFTGKYKPYMKEVLQQPHRVSYDKPSNEIKETLAERLIDRGKYFTPERCEQFAGKQHPDSIDVPHIDAERRRMFGEIASVFMRHNTRVKVIVSPYYDRIRLNPSDLRFLQSTFGKQNVYDFSGPNKWNADYHNYYDTVHYRPHVARELLKIVYEKP